MDPIKAFEDERRARIAANGTDADLRQLSDAWREKAMAEMYVYNFTSLGRPIIQFPQDMVAVQELIWDVKPDLVIETGIAHGGSLIQSAAALALLDLADATETGEMLDPRSPKRRVIGIDIDIRAHNREAIERHPLAGRITMLEGSSVDPAIVDQVIALAGDAERVLVCLDSKHTHDHVLAELEAYAPLVTPGSYCVVYDTFVEDVPAGFFADRPWDPGNSPKSAVHAWLPQNPHFEIDADIENKILVTVAPDGFLRRKT